MSKLLSKLKNYLIGRKFVGKDHIGNNYFEAQGAHPGRSRRTVTMQGIKNADSMSPRYYDDSAIPTQWRMWLSHTRKDPPSIQEIEHDLKNQELIRMRAKLVDEKWQNERNQISQEGERKRILDFELLLKNKTKIGVNPNEQEIKTSK